MTDAAVSRLVEPLALIFKLNNDMVERSLAGLADEQCWQRPSPSGNPLMWLVGHVAISRARLVGALGHKYDHGLGSGFNRGATLEEPAAYPARAAIETAWRDTRGRMREAFAGLTGEQLAAPPSAGSFPGVTDNASLIAFFAFHESYHVGQMGYVRRMLGHTGVAG